MFRNWKRKRLERLSHASAQDALREAAPTDAKHEEPESPWARRAAARQQYLLGNRWLEQNRWGEAREAWRKARNLWRSPPETPQPSLIPQLSKRKGTRAMLAFLASVCLFYALLFVLLPREPADLSALSLVQEDQEASWWERFLSTGRPSLGGENRRITMREWWQSWRARRQISKNRGEQDVPGISLEERWRELLLRYGGMNPGGSPPHPQLTAGHGLIDQGAFDEAVSVFEQGLRGAEEPWLRAELYRGLANAHYFAGYQLQAEGLAHYDLFRMRLAAQAYEETLRYAQWPMVHGNLGWTYYLLGDYAQAEQHGIQALRLNPALHYVRFNIGLLYLVQGRLKEAAQAYEFVLRQNPPPSVYMGGINDLRELLRDAPGRYPVGALILGRLSMAVLRYDLARWALAQWKRAPHPGLFWRTWAAQLEAELRVSPGKAPLRAPLRRNVPPQGADILGPAFTNIANHGSSDPRWGASLPSAEAFRSRNPAAGDLQ